MMIKMKFAFLVVLATASASVGLNIPRSETGDRYIVTFKDSASSASARGRLAASRRAFGENVVSWDKAVHGFAADLTDEEVETLKSTPGVVSLEKDGEVHAFSRDDSLVKRVPVTGTNAPWGVARIFSRTWPPVVSPQPGPTYTYTYDSTAGAGVDVYVIGTGIRVTHREFGGRARHGFSAGTLPGTDGNGHGTHIAATAIGSTVGVARRANAIAVRVLDDNGSGTISNVVTGVNWVASAAAASGRPSVLLFALGGSANTALDTAVTNLINSGVHVVVASGASNSNSDGTTSPGRVAAALLVAASTIADARAPFANYGPLIDVYAPGVSVYSAWATADDAYNTISGGSSAAAHGAGAAAYLVGLEGNTTPANLIAKIEQRSLKNVLTGVPSGTKNQLLFIGA